MTYIRGSGRRNSRARERSRRFSDSAKSESQKRLRLAPGLTLVGVGKRPDASYGAVVRVETLHEPTTIILPFESLTTPSMVEKALARVGYVRSDVKTAADAIIKALRGSEKLPTIALTDVTGWKDEFHAYAFGTETVGRPANPLLFLPSLAESGAQHQLTMGRAANGSWKAWRDGISDALRCSDVMLGAICLGLASTMAGRMGVESGLVHLFGLSTGGKTLTLVGVWSMFGPPHRERLPNWNATPTGFEEMLDTVADAPFVCDELTFLEGDSDVAKNFKSIAYAIASNRRRVRSKHWTGGAGSPVRSGRTFILSNGELSLEELTAKNKGSRRLGERCRAIDINVDMEIGCGVFNELPMGLDLDSFARKIEAACQANYGHAGFRFIQHLIGERKDWPARATLAMNKFKRRARVPSAGYAHRFAERFALAYAAGLEARRCKMLTIPAKQIRRALTRLYKRGAKNLPNPERDARRALTALKQQLSEGSAVVKVQPGKKVSTSALAATELFRRKDPKLGTFYAVRPEALVRLCGSKSAWGEAIRLLKAGGHLVSDLRGLPTRQVSFAGSDRKSRFVCIKKSFVGA